jgi:hypothetical protein
MDFWICLNYSILFIQFFPHIIKKLVYIIKECGFVHDIPELSFFNFLDGFFSSSQRFIFLIKLISYIELYKPRNVLRTIFNEGKLKILDLPISMSLWIVAPIVMALKGRKMLMVIHWTTMFPPSPSTTMNWGWTTTLPSIVP